MKHRLILLIAAAAMALVGCVQQEDMDNLNSQLDAIESGQIASIANQISAINASIETLKKTDSELKAYIEGLEKELETLTLTLVEQVDDIIVIEDQVNALRDADESLQKKIEELQEYVDGELSYENDWAEGTFATIEQFKIVSSAIATVDKRLKTCEDILDGFDIRVTEAYKDALKKAIATSETSMQKWVNEKLLTDYYTIEQFDARIAEIKKNATAADDAIKKDLDKQTEALAKAREDLTKAYTEAITKSINDFKGKIGEKLAADIKTASDALQAKIDEVNEALDDIKTRLAKLEADLDALVGQIQSIAAIPDNVDGSVNIGTSTSESIKFDIRPLAAVKALVDAGDVSVFSFKVKGVETKGGEVASISVKAAEVNDAGELVLTVDASGLGSGFAAGSQARSASLVIKSKDGVTAKSSDYFSLKYYIVLLPGKFSVSATKQVQFTRGNLYWNGSEWGLEASQTAYPTTWSTSHVGHFLWTKTASVAYAEDLPDHERRMTTDEFFCGVDNPMTIDCQSNLYALSNAEWSYLLSTRGTGDSYFKTGVTVGTATNCLIIAPDGYTGTIAESYTSAAWAAAEAGGLVCLPAAGSREDCSLLAGSGDWGYYWSATPIEDEGCVDDAYNLVFSGFGGGPSSSSRFNGSSVRLVYSDTVYPKAEIGTVDDFLFFMAHGNDTNLYPATFEVKLTADIDLNGQTFGPITEFVATLDGQGHSLKNWASEAPLFTDLKGKVANLTIDATCTTSASVCIAYIANNNNGTIENCTNNAAVKVTTAATTGTRITSFAAYNYGTIKGCTNNGSVTYEPASTPNQAIYLAGITCTLNGGTVENCTNNAKVAFAPVAVTAKAYQRVGGIASICIKNNNAIIKNCVNTQNAPVSIADPSGLITNAYAGNIVGEIEVKSVSVLENCSAFGDVTTNVKNDNAQIGGIAGKIGKYSVATTLMNGCVVNCNITGAHKTTKTPEYNFLNSCGMIAGRLGGNLASVPLTLGTTDNPVKVSGTINITASTGVEAQSVTISADNFGSYVVGNGSGVSTTVGTAGQVINAKYEVVTKQ